MTDSARPPSTVCLSTGQEFQIRAVEAEDLLSVAQLLCDSFYPPTRYWRWVIPLLRVGIYQDLRSRFVAQSPKHACLVAVIPAIHPHQQEQLVGTVEVTLKSLWWVRRPVPYLSNLAVAPSHRRQGVAQHLLLACEHIACTWHAKALYLNVLKANAAAQQLYTKADYQPDPTITLWPRLGRSKRLLLRKILESPAISAISANTAPLARPSQGYGL